MIKFNYCLNLKKSHSVVDIKSLNIYLSKLKALNI